MYVPGQSAYGPPYQKGCWRYDVATGMWFKLNIVPETDVALTAQSFVVELDDGQLLIGGGYGLTAASLSEDKSKAQEHAEGVNLFAKLMGLKNKFGDDTSRAFQEAVEFQEHASGGIFSMQIEAGKNSHSQYPEHNLDHSCSPCSLYPTDLYPLLSLFTPPLRSQLPMESVLSSPLLSQTPLFLLPSLCFARYLGYLLLQGRLQNVTLKGLKSEEYNGRTGGVMSYDHDKGRFQVRLDPCRARAKPA